MKLIVQKSPNFNSREGHAIDMLVLHYTGMRSGLAAIDRLCDESAKVSAHYAIEEDGRIFQLVEESERAWHAGVSYWRGNTNINQRSIGIEIVNPGHEYGYRAFPKVQMESVAELCADILSRHTIPARNIVAHSDIAPARKQDPGELFDWKWLSGNGVGIFPVIPAKAGISLDAQNEIPAFAGMTELKNYGYDITDLPATITAFQRHFRQHLLNGAWDAECDTLLATLIELSY